MPKLTQSVPKYRKHSSGSARVTINGRDDLLGPWKSKTSIQEYDRVIADYLAHCRGYFGKGQSSECDRVKPALKPLKHLYRDHVAIEFGPQCDKGVRQSMVSVP